MADERKACLNYYIGKYLKRNLPDESPEQSIIHPVRNSHILGQILHTVLPAAVKSWECVIFAPSHPDWGQCKSRGNLSRVFFVGVTLGQ
jgi:hypothetical protein